jgi:hypothetical protein
MKHYFKTFLVAAMVGFFLLVMGGCTISTYNTGHPKPGHINSYTMNSSSTTVHHIYHVEPGEKKSTHHRDTIGKNDRWKSAEKERGKAARRARERSKDRKIARIDRFKDRHRNHTPKTRTRDTSHRDHTVSRDKSRDTRTDRNRARDRSKDRFRDDRHGNRDDRHGNRDAHANTTRDRDRLLRVKKSPSRTDKVSGRSHGRTLDSSCDEDSRASAHQTLSRSRSRHTSR